MRVCIVGGGGREHALAHAVAQSGHQVAVAPGVLYCALMLTVEGPKLVEYNVRLRDPEAQAILARYAGELAEAHSEVRA